MPFKNENDRREYNKLYMQQKREKQKLIQKQGYTQTLNGLVNDIVVELVVENKIQQEVLPEINNNIQKQGYTQTNSKPKWIFSPYENMKPFVCRIPDANGNISQQSQTIILHTI